MSIPIAAKKEYFIAFDTTSTPGFIRSVKITIETDMLPDDALAPKADHIYYPINLQDHPLYPHLRQFCITNK